MPILRWAFSRAICVLRLRQAWLADRPATRSGSDPLRVGDDQFAGTARLARPALADGAIWRPPDPDVGATWIAVLVDGTGAATAGAIAMPADGATRTADAAGAMTAGATAMPADGAASTPDAPRLIDCET